MSNWRLLPTLTLLICGCALTGAPYVATPLVPENASTLTRNDTCPPGTLSFIEGQPRGLLIALELTPTTPECEDSAADTVTLMRLARHPDGSTDPFEALITFDRKTHADSLFAKGSATFLDDRELKAGVQYSYLLSTQEPETPQRKTKPISVTWKAPPQAPTSFAADVVGGHVYLSWALPDVSTPEATVIFRRDLTRQGPYQRLAGPIRSSAKDFVDDDQRPGAVYGYLISAVSFSDEVAIIGPPSQELFVETTPP